MPEVVFRSFEPESFAAASIGQVHRAVLPTGEAVAVKVQRPGIRETLQADIDLMYSLTRVFDRTHLFGASRSRDGHRRVRALDRRRAGLPRRGAPGDDAPRARRPTDTRADRARLPRIHDLAGPDLGAHRGRPADRRHGRPAHGRRPFLEHFRRRARPGPGHEEPRLEHAQPGLRVGLFPRRPAPGEPVRDAGRRDRLCGPRDRRPAPGTRPRFPDALQLAPLPGRGRAGHPGADALAHADPGDRQRRRPMAPHPDPPGIPVRRGQQASREHVAAAWARRPRGRESVLRLAVEIMRVIREHHLVLAQSVVAYLKMLVTIGALRHELATSSTTSHDTSGDSSVG